MRLLILISISIFTISSVYTQEKKKHYSSWNTINITKSFNNKWSINAEFDFRRTNFLKDWEQIILRPTVHYKFERDLDIALGYSYIKNYSYSSFSAPINANENNIFQQFTIKHKFSKFSFDHRLRFEERFIDKVTQGQDDSYFISGTKYRNRFRYKFQIVKLLKAFNNRQQLNLLIYDEAFLDLRNGLRPEKLDQNWMFIGLNFKLNKHINIKSGYHDVYAKRGYIFINNQIWETALTYKI